MAAEHLKTGQAAEQAACHWLETHGLCLVARNQRWRDGELDLVMRDGNTLVFVEVRYRASSHYGGAAASITRSKQQRLIRAAGHFLAAHPALAQLPCRFDVITACGNPATPEINWLRDAFTAQ
ncbi:MAG: YraN family protein [Pseudomonadota bacterium]|nr:YraN family protein [Pseudomonadota bacterium]